MIKTIPLSFEEQDFIANRIGHGIMTGGLFTNNSIVGIAGFVILFIFALNVVNKKQKNKWLNLLFKFLIAFSIIFSMFALLSFDSISFSIGAPDFWSNISELTFAIAMIINDPSNWWRVLLLVIPGLVIPKIIQNLFRKLPWNYNSIGKIFGNLYAGLAIGTISTIVLVMTGKSPKKKQEERKSELEKLRLYEPIKNSKI